MSDRTAAERQWEAYFEASGHTVFQHLLMAHRRTFISRALAHWFEVFFPATGVYVEPGAGTSESSARIRPRHRTLVAVDFCHFVLAHLNVPENRGQADISSLLFSNGSVDGIWNLGGWSTLATTTSIEFSSSFDRCSVRREESCCCSPPGTLRTSCY